MPLTVLDADVSSCASSPSNTVKAPGSLKLRWKILVNKQVSKRGQITVKPSKDGCCWNKPWRLESQRALLRSESLFLHLTQGQCLSLPKSTLHGVWVHVESPGPLPLNCVKNVGGRKFHRKYYNVAICSDKLFSVQSLCWALIPDSVTNEMWRLGESSTMQHLCSVYFALCPSALQKSFFFYSYKARPLLTEKSTGVLTIPPAERIIS